MSSKKKLFLSVCLWLSVWLLGAILEVSAEESLKLAIDSKSTKK